MTRNVKVILGAVVVVGAGLLGLAIRGHSEAAPQGQDLVVQTALVKRAPLDVTAEAAGTVEPSDTVAVKSRASGEILALPADVGDQVTRGTLLARIDPRDVRNALAQAQANLEVAKAQLASDTAQLRRDSLLLKTNVITKQEYEQARLTAAQGQSDLIKARTNLELAQKNMADVTIVAPIDGTIIQRPVAPGQIIASASQPSGGTLLFLMANLARMQVRAMVDETDIGQVRPGQQAEVTVESYPGRQFPGMVKKIEPQALVTQSVTMFPVVIELENRDRMLKPGMNADVQIQVEERRVALVIPSDAIVDPTDASDMARPLGQSAESYVTAALAARDSVVKEDGKLARPGLVFVASGSRIEPRTVVLGAEDWQNTEVLDGLREGDRVLLASSLRRAEQSQRVAKTEGRKPGPIVPDLGRAGAAKE